MKEARPDARSQAVARIVRLPDDLFLRLERDHREHRAENLFLGHAHPVVDLREDGWLNEKSMHQLWIGGDLPSIDQVRAFLLGNIDVALDLFLLAFEGRRTHLGLHLQRIAQLDGVRALGQPADDLIMDASLHKEPRAGDTGLATGGEDARNDAVDHPFIRVVENDVGRLATQFEAHTGQVIGGVLHDPDAGRGRSGEGYLVYPWMAHQRPAGAGTIAGHDVEDAGREARFGEESGEFKCGRRRVLGGFDDKGTAGASLKDSSKSGEFQGVMAPTTPMGSRRV